MRLPPSPMPRLFCTSRAAFRPTIIQISCKLVKIRRALSRTLYSQPFFTRPHTSCVCVAPPKSIWLFPQHILLTAAYQARTDMTIRRIARKAKLIPENRRRKCRMSSSMTIALLLLVVCFIVRMPIGIGLLVTSFTYLLLTGMDPSIIAEILSIPSTSIQRFKIAVNTNRYKNIFPV